MIDASVFAGSLDTGFCFPGGKNTGDGSVRNTDPTMLRCASVEIPAVIMRLE